jgi:hypothetical protein
MVAADGDLLLPCYPPRRSNHTHHTALKMNLTGDIVLIAVVIERLLLLTSKGSNVPYSL